MTGNQSKVYHRRFIPCRFSCQSHEMYNKKTFYPSRERIEKKKFEIQILHDQRGTYPRVAIKSNRKDSDKFLSIFCFIHSVRKNTTIVFALARG